MPRITRLEAVESIKPGDPPEIAPDGTILNPVAYEAVDITFDDGVSVQVERPLTLTKVVAAWKDAQATIRVKIDGIGVSDVITVPP